MLLSTFFGLIILSIALTGVLGTSAYFLLKNRIQGSNAHRWAYMCRSRLAWPMFAYVPIFVISILMGNLKIELDIVSLLNIVAWAAAITLSYLLIVFLIVFDRLAVRKGHQSLFLDLILVRDLKIL